jgi:dipeptidyl aminopeptidase/acylaminoacyl peptidase
MKVGTALAAAAWAWAWAGVVATLPASAQTSDATRTAQAFGARELIQQISLSPDGTRVAYITPNGAHGTAVMVAQPFAGGAPTPVLATPGDEGDRLSDCHWATDQRLICRVVVIQRDPTVRNLVVTRLVAVDADGKNQKMISARTSSRALRGSQDGGQVIDWLGDGKGGLLMTRDFVPENTIGSNIKAPAIGLGVEKVDVSTLRRLVVERGRDTAIEYITDGNGAVRIMGLLPRGPDGSNGDTIDYLYRRPGAETWEPLSKLRNTRGNGYDDGFDPYAIDRKLNVAYGFDQKDGRQALYRVALDGSLKRELVLDNPNVDVDGLIRIGRERRVVGASYATERREKVFFDPELAALSRALGKALPGAPIVGIVDASEGEKHLLIFAGSDTDPGRYYVFDKATRKLTEVLPARPALREVKLGTMKPVTFPAADGTPIPGYLTLPAGSDGRNLPAIVMPHGGPGARDEWGFDWWAQYFAARGFAVLQPNFRGSTGYGSAWFQKNGFQSWRTAVGDVDDAGRWLVKQGIAAPGKLAIVGWSYGGYAALQSGVLAPDLFKAIIAVAPVTDLETLRSEAFGFASYPQVDRFIGHGAHVKEGSPARNVDRIDVPVLLFHGDRDVNVGVGESRLMEKALKGAGKPVDYVEFKGLDHQLDDSVARAEMLEKSDAFLRSALKL